MSVFWSKIHQTFGRGKSSYALDVLSSDIELGIQQRTGFMMNHRSQNIFYESKLPCRVFVRGLTRIMLGTYLEYSLCSANCWHGPPGKFFPWLD